MFLYIYALHCPKSGDVKYVGKTSDPERRFRQHGEGIRGQRRGYLAPGPQRAYAHFRAVGDPVFSVLEVVDKRCYEQAGYRTGTISPSESRESYWISQFPTVTNVRK